LPRFSLPTRDEESGNMNTCPLPDWQGNTLHGFELSGPAPGPMTLLFWQGDFQTPGGRTAQAQPEPTLNTSITEIINRATDGAIPFISFQHGIVSVEVKSRNRFLN
jgi:hypothetical protein